MHKLPRFSSNCKQNCKWRSVKLQWEHFLFWDWKETITRLVHLWQWHLRRRPQMSCFVMMGQQSGVRDQSYENKQSNFCTACGCVLVGRRFESGLRHWSSLTYTFLPLSCTLLLLIPWNWYYRYWNRSFDAFSCKIVFVLEKKINVCVVLMLFFNTFLVFWVLFV